MTLKQNKWKERLKFLISCFTEHDTLEELALQLGDYLSLQLPVKGIALVHLVENENTQYQENGIWTELGSEGSRLLDKAVAKNVELLRQGKKVSSYLETFAFEEIQLVMKYRQFPIYVDNKISGFMLLWVETDQWEEEEADFLELLVNALGIFYEYQDSVESEKLSSFVFNTILNGLKANIYISDLETERILFMNQTMIKEFGLVNPKGQICWKLLQRGMNQRCSFCPIEELKRQPIKTVIQWEEINSVTGKIYCNYDSLIRWIDGKIVHLQQSIDMTELKYANTDELTQLMARRPGKEALRQTLKQAAVGNKTITVCMYDINKLKQVNDQYGHEKGDCLITSVSSAVRGILQRDEYAFRLSGDEFVVVFQDERKNVTLRIAQVQEQLHHISAEYEISFCYGLVEIIPGQQMTIEEVLFLADERMYNQKRRYHILYNEQLRLTEVEPENTASFIYNKELIYDALVQSTDDYIYVCNMKTGIFKYPKAMVEEFDLPGQVIENAAAIWGAKVHEDDRQAFLESNQEITDGRTKVHCAEYRVKNRRGEWVWVLCRGHIQCDVDGKPELFAGFITNLGKKNKIDHITGLFNKLEFKELVNHLIETVPQQKFGLMILGIDDLKHINDLHDRTFGDEVIRITSHRLQTMLPATAALFRLDGDEFGIIVRESGMEATTLGMEKIYRTIQQSFECQQNYDGKKFYCTLSAGCVVYPTDAENYLDLMKYAGYSLQYSKNNGKKRCTNFSQEMLGHRGRILEMTEALRESVENNFEGFSLCFQPIVSAQDGRLNGVEALARWQCQQFGQVSPIEFIPLLEQSGLIVPVGKWVFHTAICTCRDWEKQLPGLVLDVNLSFVQVQEADIVTFLKDELEKETFPAGNLVVELTESYFGGDNPKIQMTLEAIRSMGVRIAMDDFGTGYSSLGILKHTPADIVKIDKTFVQDIQNSNFDATFIRFVVSLCHDVGIKVCLEGVETQEEYKLISPMGLDMIQGFLFDQPLKEQEFVLKYIKQ